MVASPNGLEPEKECADNGQQHIQKTDPSSRQRGRHTKTNTQLSGRELQMGLYSKRD
jgi:hypothetical protein